MRYDAVAPLTHLNADIAAGDDGALRDLAAGATRTWKRLAGAGPWQRMLWRLRTPRFSPHEYSAVVAAVSTAALRASRDDIAAVRRRRPTLTRGVVRPGFTLAAVAFLECLELLLDDELDQRDQSIGGAPMPRPQSPVTDPWWRSTVVRLR